MSTVSLPIQFVRQNAVPIDIDSVFTTTADRTAYLTNPRRYAGQIVADLEDGTIYMLSGTSSWVAAGSTGGGSAYTLPSAAVFTSVSALSVSGVFYGDGSALSGVVHTQYTLPSAVTFAVSVSSPALSGSFYGDGTNLTGVLHSYTLSAASNSELGGVKVDGTSITISDGVISASAYVLPSTVTFVSVSAGSLSGSHYGDGSKLQGILASGGTAVDSSKLALTGGTINGNLTVIGNLTATGITTFANTTFSTSSALSVVNTSPVSGVPALYVGQSGPSDIASFYDIDQGIEVLHIGGVNSIYPNVGIKTSSPNKTFTVAGEISATGDISTSGFYYGDGSNLAGVIHTQYELPSAVAFVTSVSSPALSGTFYGDGSNLTNLPAGANPVGSLSGTWENTASVVQANSASWGAGGNGTGSAYTYTTDLTVSLPTGKTFGRYNTGDIIPAIGKTAGQVIELAISAPLPPTVTLTTSTSIAFNQPAISNVLNFTRIINTLGATVSAASLEWRRNNSGSWTVLSTITTNSSYTHDLTDTEFTPFNYKYTVTDTQGATATTTLNITPAGYAAPATTLNVVAQSITSPETNSAREKGNTPSTISGSIVKTAANTTLTSYVIQYQVDSGSWTDIGTATSITGDSATISAFNHTAPGATTASTVKYRIAVTDNYTTSYLSTYTISFAYLMFYGATASTPTDSTSVRTLGTRVFSLANPFILNTGTTYTKFTVALPDSQSITLVQDLDASNANLTTNYVNSNLNVNDGGGNGIAYHVYTLSIATPYGSSHRHQITRA